MNLESDKKIITEAFITGINISNARLFEIIKGHFDKVKPVFPLIEFTIERLSAVTDLAIRNCNWDAEIIYRSALEGFVKLTYILNSQQERDTRLKEYRESLAEINSIKISEQAKKSLSVHNYNETSALAFKPMILEDEMESMLREKWPRGERKKLEQKWSFTEMIISLAKCNNVFIGLAHNYRYASHVTHADETGVSMIVERQQRTENERAIADMAHYIRLLGDSFFFCVSIGLEVSILTGQNPKFFFDLGDSIKEVSQLGDKYLQKLQEDKLYDKFRKIAE